MEMLEIPPKSPEATWQHHQWTPQQNQSQNRMMAGDDLFPIQQAREGLSLSLYNPAAAGALQPFQHPISAGGRETKLYSFQHDGRYCESLPKSCRYLVAAQQLLNEFCSLDGGGGSTKHRKSGNGSSSFSSYNHSLNSLDLPELQKRKSRLISMLEEEVQEVL